MDIESSDTIKFAIDHAKDQLQPIITEAIRSITVNARSLIDEAFNNVMDIEVVIGPITIPAITIKVKRGTPPQQ